MKLLGASSLTLALTLMGGCAATPPQPAGCSGQFRAVNPIEQRGAVVLGVSQSAAVCPGDDRAQS